MNVYLNHLRSFGLKVELLELKALAIVTIRKALMKSYIVQTKIAYPRIFGIFQLVLTFF